MDVTESGMMTLARLLQFQNAALPMEVTESPIVTLVRLVQSLNA